MLERLRESMIESIKKGATIGAVATEFELTVGQVFALLWDVKDADVQKAIFEAKHLFKGDYRMAKERKEELIEQVKRIYSDDFSTGDEVQVVEEENQVTNVEIENHGTDVEEENQVTLKSQFSGMSAEDMLSLLLVKIADMQNRMQSIEERINAIEENVGFSKYRSIREYIKIHETITTENLERIFGTYAKKVLYRLADDGYVKKIAKGIYRYEGGKNGKEREKE